MVQVKIKVKPRSKKDGFEAADEDGTITVRLKAPAVDGKANQALIKFLSEALGIRRKDISILVGEKSRHKVLVLEGIEPQDLRRALSATP